MYAIEKNIPAPVVSRKRGRHPKYPYAFMEVGDSFYAPGIPSLSASLRAAEARTGFRFAQAHEDGGTRVWRIAAAPEPPASEPPAAPVAEVAPRLPRVRCPRSGAPAPVDHPPRRLTVDPERGRPGP